MTSEEEERPSFVTGGYGWHRLQWVKNTFTILVASSSIFFIQLHVVWLTFEICLRWFFIFLTSEAHFTALEFGFQVSSHTVLKYKLVHGLIVYLVRTSMNFAHSAGFQALSFVDRINRPDKDRHPCRWDERIRRNPSQDAAFFTKSEHTIKQAAALSSPVSTVFARNAWVFTSLFPSFFLI